MAIINSYQNFDNISLNADFIFQDLGDYERKIVATMLLLEKVALIIYLTNTIQCKEEKQNVKYETDENTKVKLKDNNNDTTINELKDESMDTEETDTQQTDPDGFRKPEPGFDLSEAEITKFKIWPKGVIPYYIDDVSFDNGLRNRIRQILNEFNHITSLRFTELSAPPKDDNERWVLFINRRGALGCEDYTTKSFTNSGVQKIVLGYDCVGNGGGTLAATVLALAGIPPQHNAPDRDNYIDVIMENIIPEKRDLFQKLKDTDWLFHQVPYDFISAGHYNLHKYSNNGSATIIPKTEEYIHVTIGEEDGISPKDVWKIRMLYNFISLSRKKAKASDCSEMFKPGSKFDSFRPLVHKTEDNNIIKPRQKPSKYLGEFHGASKGFEKLSKKKRPHKKDKLGALEDFDTDVDARNNKRQKLAGKLKGGLMTVHSNRNKKNRLSKLYMMSDINTDSDNQ